MTTIRNYLNENGNVSASKRKALKDQTKSKIVSQLKLGEKPLEPICGKSGNISVMLGHDTNDEPIYAHLSITINQNDPDYVAVKKSKGTKVEEPIENIF